MSNTANLSIPLIDTSKPLLSVQFNAALEQIDKNALHKNHAGSNAHWPMWRAATVYKKQDVFRTSTIPAWGFWEVTSPGTSGDTEPVGHGEGDTAEDGTCRLILRRLTASAEIDDWRLWKKFLPDTAYAEGDVFRTPTTPSWGYWQVTAAGTSAAKVPNGTTEGATITSGTMTCELKRIGSGSGGTSSEDMGKAVPWETNTPYPVNKLVRHGDNLYMCLVAHISGDFAQDEEAGYWKKIGSDQTVIGSNGGYSQITKLNVTATPAAPKVVDIAINKTRTFCLPPVEVLRFEAGAAGQVLTECDFMNDEESDFLHTETVIFDGTMHPKTNYSSPAAVSLATEGNYIAESAFIRIGDYKVFEGAYLS